MKTIRQVETVLEKPLPAKRLYQIIFTCFFGSPAVCYLITDPAALRSWNLFQIAVSETG